MVRQMAMKATDFGQNLETNLKRNEPEDPKTLPKDLAFDVLAHPVSLLVCTPYEIIPNSINLSWSNPCGPQLSLATTMAMLQPGSFKL